MGMDERTSTAGQHLYQETGAGTQYQRAQGVVMTTSTCTTMHVRPTRDRFVPPRRCCFITSTSAADDDSCGIPSFVQFKDGFRLSAKEMIHPEPIEPDWFVSHWWGDSVVSFIERCEMHAQSHLMKWRTPHGHTCDHTDIDKYAYWVCAFANNQHDLAAEIVKSPMLGCCQKTFSPPMRTRRTRVHGIFNSRLNELLWASLPRWSKGMPHK